MSWSFSMESILKCIFFFFCHYWWYNCLLVPDLACSLLPSLGFRIFLCLSVVSLQAPEDYLGWEVFSWRGSNFFLSLRKWMWELEMEIYIPLAPTTSLCLLKLDHLFLQTEHGEFEHVKLCLFRVFCKNSDPASLMFCWSSSCDPWYLLTGQASLVGLEV